jgi:hypothetical protein
LNCSSCESTCYAKNAAVQYKNCEVFRLVNLYLLNNHADILKELIVAQMEKSNYRTLRIHSSGDFASQEEITMWDDIVSSHQDHKFYAYTKVNEILDFTVLNSRANFNLIESLISHEGKKLMNYGSMAYITKTAEKVGGFVCPATTLGDVKCNRECTYCVTDNKPLFLIHGTRKGKTAKA